MEPLATELKIKHRILKQVKREGRVALYELYGANDMLYGFEVIVIKIAPAEHMFGKDYPEREIYPGNEDWGKLAWSYGRDYRDMAEECFVKCLGKLRGSVPVEHFVAV